MKRSFVYLVIAMLLAVSLCGCGNNGGYDDKIYTSPMPTAIPSASPHASSGMDDSLDDGLVTDKDGIIEDSDDAKNSIKDSVKGDTSTTESRDNMNGTNSAASPSPNASTGTKSGSMGD